MMKHLWKATELVPELVRDGAAPAILFLCMPFGARRAAEQLAEAGLPMVIWMKADLGIAARSSIIFFGTTWAWARNLKNGMN